MARNEDDGLDEQAYSLAYVSSQDDAAIGESGDYSSDYIYGKGWICEK